MSKNKLMKKMGAVALALTMAFSFGTANVHALESEWSHGECYGEVGYNTYYGFGSTSCYEEHLSLSVEIDVRYIAGKTVYHASDLSVDYFTTDVEIGGPSYEVIGVYGIHHVIFSNGHCTGYTMDGSWRPE